jgi:2-aminoadipate transaminase
VLVTLDPSLDLPLYVQIRDQLRERIATGALKPGDRLEPSREHAYADLEAEGLIAGTVGRGTFVASLGAGVPTVARPAPRAVHDVFWDRVLSQESQDDSLGRLMASALDPEAISFASTRATEEVVPLELVRRATDAVLRREGSKLLQYGSSDGYPPLRQYLQARLRRDGIPVELDEILITNGCQQSLDLLRHSLIGADDAAACENPTYTGLCNVFRVPGSRLIGVPVGAEGMDLAYLAATLEQNKVKLILTSPNFQNPTGRTMPLANRRRLLELAARYQTPVVEDDIYGALRFRGREIPPLKALDTSGLVIYLNSFSKVGFPGFRVGWVVAAGRVIERLRAAKQRADLHTNLLSQAVLEEFGRRGWLDKLLRRTRKVNERKLAVLERAAARHFPPEARVNYPEGGMSVWVELPPDLDAAELLARARDRKVIFVPARYFYFQNPQHNAFRLCFTGLADDKIERGVAVLGELLKAEIRKGKTGKRRAPVGSGVALV